MYGAIFYNVSWWADVLARVLSGFNEQCEFDSIRCSYLSGRFVVGKNRCRPGGASTYRCLQLSNNATTRQAILGHSRTTE